MPGEDKMKYKQQLSYNINNKGVFDVDTIKGCFMGMSEYPKNGCYDSCYACSIAKRYGYDFSKSVNRNFNKKIIKSIRTKLKKHFLNWFRIGTMGDPSHNWEHTCCVIKELYDLKIPIIITKHWLEIPYNILNEFKQMNVIINTSISALDTDKELAYRLYQYKKLKNKGVKSILRVVTCKFSKTRRGKYLNNIQNELLSNEAVINNPLRLNRNNKLVKEGTVLVNRIYDIKSNVLMSYDDNKAYTGHCFWCNDQCGINL
jgi:hypothetical protein